MKRICALLAGLCACASSTSGLAPAADAPPGAPIIDAPFDTPIVDRPDAGGMPTFDPCVPDPKPGYDPVAAGLAACCVGTGPAHCVPTDDILPALAAQLAPCDGTTVCMPDPIIHGGGQYQPPSCTSSLGSLPGACLSKCIPLVANNPQSGFLFQDGCGQGELCIPCTNPITGMPTGACNLIELLCMPEMPDAGVGAPDAGPPPCPHQGPPIIDPATFPECSPACGGAHCVPAALVPPAQQPLLHACPAAGGGPGLCAPDELIATGGNFVPPTCTSVAGAEGRCLSTCLPDIAAKGALLPQDVCAEGERCAPCFDPTATDPTVPTGACSIACDSPTQPPLMLTCPWTGPPVVDPAVFPACEPACGGAHCVPAALVPAAQQGLLATCPGGFCAPDEIIATAGKPVPVTCTSLAGAEGRCLSTCIPVVAARASLLPRDVCDEDERCAPCFDPTSSDPTAETGACGIGCDSPAQPPVELTCPWTGPPVVDPAVFPGCEPACGGSHCVPADLVPSDVQPLLAMCTGGFCVPDPIVSTGGNFVPQTCTSVAGAEGRCLSTCIPEIAQKQDLLPRDVCAEAERCAPCYDPTSPDPTVPTGACSLSSCDVPKQPPVVLTCPWTGPPVVDPASFPECDPACAGSHCVPAELIPEEERALLAPCTGGFCAPDPIIATANHFVPPTCVSVAGAEGRCLSTCLPPIAAQAQFLPQSTCSAGLKCAPCFNPTAADPTAATGACGLACDEPTQPPVILTCPWEGPAVLDPQQLPACDPPCPGSHCLPAELVPEEDRALLATCPGGFCTPDPLIQAGGNYVPPTCTSIAGAEGRCLSTCLPPIAAQTLLPQGTCAPGNRCAPCFNPIASDPTAPTGACGLSCDEPTEPPVVLTCNWTGPAVIDPAVLPSCAGGQCINAHCLPGEFVPPSQQAQLDPCPDGSSFCTPDPLITTAGHFLPPTCTAFAGTPAQGRCLSLCLPAVESQPTLEQSSCVAGNRCAPCADPITGVDTGACETVSCDAAPSPPYTFPNCCNFQGSSQGRCVPRSQVPDDQEGNLLQDVCSSPNYLCVPNENLPGGSGGQGCTGTIIFDYSGSCFSNCVDLGLGTIFPRGDCPSNHTCVPCAFAPGGSPGC